MTFRRAVMSAAVVCLVAALGAPAQASQPGPSTITYEPATTISEAHLRTMKHYGWDVRNVAARHTKISRARAIAIVGGQGSASRVTEAALIQVATSDSANHRLMWAVITETTLESRTDPWSLGGPITVGQDPRTVTKVDPLTGDVVLPPDVSHPLPSRVWTIDNVMLIDPETGKQPVGMSL